MHVVPKRRRNVLYFLLGFSLSLKQLCTYLERKWLRSIRRLIERYIRVSSWAISLISVPKFAPTHSSHNCNAQCQSRARALPSPRWLKCQKDRAAAAAAAAACRDHRTADGHEKKTVERRGGQGQGARACEWTGKESTEPEHGTYNAAPPVPSPPRRRWSDHFRFTSQFRITLTHSTRWLLDASSQRRTLRSG